MSAFPEFRTVARLRPVTMTVPLDGPVLAPYISVEAAPGADPLTPTISSGDVTLSARLDGHGRVELLVDAGRHHTEHRSRRHGRAKGPVEAVGLTLTGPQLTAFTREGGVWHARARVALKGRVDVHDEAFLAGLAGSCDGEPADLKVGGFGQLGLRDIRVASHADGTAYTLGDGRFLLTAASAGPGFFDTGHTSVWALDGASLELEHRADLFFRRPDKPGVYGDHATHLVRDAGRWLVATSTWGDFDRGVPGASVAVTLAETEADLDRGRHVLDTKPLPLPTTGLKSVGVWDPHLARTEDGWLVGYVSARKFFDFHPVLATGTELNALEVRAATAKRRATEGTTLLHLEDGWRVLASDGRDNRRKHQAAYPVFDLDLRQVGKIEADYPTNIPWPTLVRDAEGWLMIGFDGTSYGGKLLGYGTHGDVVIQRPVE